MAQTSPGAGVGIEILQRIGCKTQHSTDSDGKSTQAQGRADIRCGAANTAEGLLPLKCAAT
jgi:hypothetical protein